MKKQKVLVTRRLPGQSLKKMIRICQMEIWKEDRVMPRAKFFEKVKGKDGLLCLLTDKIDEKAFDAAGKNLRIVANYAVGYNNIDVEEATKRGIMITNTPGVLTETTADLAWSLLMTRARRIAEGDKFVRAKKYKGWAPELLLGKDVYGKTLGIVGLGRIGQAMARRAGGFGMKVIYTDIKRLEGIEKVLKKYVKIRYVKLETLLKKSDFITLHVTLGPATHHLIGKKEFQIMKKSAILVNASRGPVIDEKALVWALKTGQIYGAALDVFEKEPEVEPELLTMDKVVLVPHLGSASIETRVKMADIAVENLIAGLRGKVPPNIVNREVLKK